MAVKRTPDSRAKNNADTEIVASRSAEGSSSGRHCVPIRQSIRSSMQEYFAMLDGEPPCGLYRTVIRQVEQGLIESVLEACNGNQTRAASWLGISRVTLREKLKHCEPTPEAASDGKKARQATRKRSSAVQSAKRKVKHKPRTKRGVDSLSQPTKSVRTINGPADKSARGKR